MVRNRLADLVGANMVAPVIRARLAPNLLFFFLAPETSRQKLLAAISSFADKREKIEVIS